MKNEKSWAWLRYGNDIEIKAVILGLKYIKKSINAQKKHKKHIKCKKIVIKPQKQIKKQKIIVRKR